MKLVWNFERHWSKTVDGRLLTNKQTDRQTNRQTNGTENITSFDFVSGGNKPSTSIISLFSTVCNKLSKFLADKQSPLVSTISESHIRNSTYLVEKLKRHYGITNWSVIKYIYLVDWSWFARIFQDIFHKLDTPVSTEYFMKHLELYAIDNHYVVIG